MSSGRKPVKSAPQAARSAIGTAEAKRRFSELVDRVGHGERILVSRRGRPAVALVPPEPELLDVVEAPSGLAAIAGALADWEDIDEVVGDVYADRRTSRDRPVPELD